MKRLWVLIVASCMLVLSGCASTENQYNAYMAAETARAKAKENIEVAKYQALAAIGQSGGETAKVAAMISIMAGGGSGNSNPAQGLQPPVSASQTAFQWASLLVPTLTQGLVQGYTINRNTALGMKQSDNSLAASTNLNSTMLGFGELIRSPVVVTQPAPVIVTQPDPVIVNPVVVRPEVIQQPAPTPAPTL